MIEIENYGRIKYWTLPDGWSEETKHSEGSSSALRRFVLDENNDVQLVVYTRNLPISFNSCAELRKLLDLPNHELTPKEQWQVQEVLQTMPSKREFQPLSIRTEIVDEVKIITGEGRWIGINFDTLSFFVDEGGEYAVIQQIYFAAPKEVYASHFTQAKTIMYSIKFLPP